ncbi:MAG TPA: hypothetical protein VGN29_10060 [Solirubrobacteraceae bacterium]|nr:hypothetical protein [Solirubrobacteraceae bacterium]
MGRQFAADDKCHRDGSAAGIRLDVDRSGDRIPGTLDADHAGVEVDVDPLQASELAPAKAAEQRDCPERLLAVGERAEQLVRDLGRLDPVATSADSREVEVVGRVDRDLVSAHRPPEDDAQRIEDVRDGRGGQALGAEVVDEVLNVAPVDLRQLEAAERRHDVGLEQLLVAASGRRLVGLASAVEDRAVVRAGDQDLGGLGDRLRCRRPHRAAPQSDLRVLAPQLRRTQRRERSPDLPAGPGVVRLRLVGRLAIAPAAPVSRLAAASVTSADPGSHVGARC